MWCVGSKRTIDNMSQKTCKEARKYTPVLIEDQRPYISDIYFNELALGSGYSISEFFFRDFVVTYTTLFGRCFSCTEVLESLVTPDSKSPPLVMVVAVARQSGKDRHRQRCSETLSIQEKRASTNRHKIFSLVIAVLVVEVLLCADQDLAAASLGL